MIDPHNLGAKLLPSYPHTPSLAITRHIEWYEGPLLTLFITHNDRYILKYWCDCSDDGKNHRWLVFETYANLLDGYQNQRISLRELMDASCNGKAIYLLENEEKWVVEYDRLPADYRPV